MTRRRIVRLAVLIGAGALATVPFAAADGRVDHHGPFPHTSADTGSCGNAWALVNGDTRFMVDSQPTADGSYDVRQAFTVEFVTVAGASPGTCDPDNAEKPYPKTVAAGIEGSAQGYFDLTIENGQYNADATCPANCTPRSFRIAFFGPESRFGPLSAYRFHYNAPDASDYVEWKAASANRGGDHGDICCTSRR